MLVLRATKADKPNQTKTETEEPKRIKLKNSVSQFTYVYMVYEEHQSKIIILNTFAFCSQKKYAKVNVILSRLHKCPFYYLVSLVPCTICPHLLVGSDLFGVSAIESFLRFLFVRVCAMCHMMNVSLQYRHRIYGLAFTKLKTENKK